MSLFRVNVISKTTLFHVASNNEELTELGEVMNFYTCQVYDMSWTLRNISLQRLFLTTFNLVASCFRNNMSSVHRIQLLQYISILIKR